MIIPGSRTSLAFEREWEDNVHRARRDGMPQIHTGKSRLSTWPTWLAKFFGAGGSAEVVVAPVPAVREAVQEIADEIADVVDAGITDIEAAIEAGDTPETSDA